MRFKIFFKPYIIYYSQKIPFWVAFHCHSYYFLPHGYQSDYFGCVCGNSAEISLGEAVVSVNAPTEYKSVLTIIYFCQKMLSNSKFLSFYF